MTKIKGLRELKKEADARGVNVRELADEILDSSAFHILNKAYRAGVAELEKKNARKTPFVIGLIEENPWKDVSTGVMIFAAAMLSNVDARLLGALCKLPEDEVRTVIAYAQLVACQLATEFPDPEFPSPPAPPTSGEVVH